MKALKKMERLTAWIKKKSSFNSFSGFWAVAVQ
jgi:hypothetical protein